MKHVKKIIAVALVLTALMGIAIPAGASASTVVMYTNAPQVAVRNSARTDISNVHTRLNKGYALNVSDSTFVSHGDVWRSTSDFGSTKYIMAEFLQSTKP